MISHKDILYHFMNKLVKKSKFHINIILAVIHKNGVLYENEKSSIDGNVCWTDNSVRVDE